MVPDDNGWRALIGIAHEEVPRRCQLIGDGFVRDGEWSTEEILLPSFVPDRIDPRARESDCRNAETAGLAGRVRDDDRDGGT